MLITVGVNDYANIINASGGNRDPGYDIANELHKRYAGLIDRILSVRPRASVLFTSILPGGNPSIPAVFDAHSTLATANTKLPSLDDTRGSHVKFYNGRQLQGTGLTWAATDWNAGDVIHPNDSGYQKIAEFWFRSVKDYLDNHGLPTTDYSDTVPPVYEMSSPANGAVNVSNQGALFIEFDQHIKRGTTGNITLKNLSGGADKVIPITDTAQIAMTRWEMTITPTGGLSLSTQYAFQIDAGAVSDLFDNPIAAISDTTTLAFTTSSTVLPLYAQDFSANSTGWTNGGSVTMTRTSGRFQAGSNNQCAYAYTGATFTGDLAYAAKIHNANSERCGLLFNSPSGIANRGYVFAVNKSNAVEMHKIDTTRTLTNFNLNGNTTMVQSVSRTTGANKTYDLKVVVNSATNTADCWLDNVLVFDNFPLTNFLNGSVGFVGSFNVSGAWIDDVIVRRPSTMAITPTFSLADGAYASGTTYTISNPEPGGSIRYTTDGTYPSETVGTLYTGGNLIITSSVVVKAICYAAGITPSAIATANFTLSTSPPVFSLAAGAYDTNQTLALTSATSGAEIRYTTDGSDPSGFVGELYSGPIAIDRSMTVKAVAAATGLQPSAIGARTYTLQPQVPAISPPGGTFNPTQTVALTCPTVGAAIRFTTDGSTPTASTGFPYTGPFVLSASTVLKAIATTTNPGWDISPVATATFTLVVPSVEVPLYSQDFSVDAANWTRATDATSTTMALNTQRFQVSGNNQTSYYYSGSAQPFSGPLVYTARLNVSNAERVGLLFNKPGGTVTRGYVFGFSKANAVEMHKIDGTRTLSFYNLNGNTTLLQSVARTTGANKVATLRVVLDPTTNTCDCFFDGVLIFNDFPLTDYLSGTVGFVGSFNTAAAWIDDVGVSRITPLAERPTFNPPGGTYAGAQSVTISTATTGASIRYTTDGTDPSDTIGTLYTGPVSVAATTTLKAIAFQSGHVSEGIGAATYTIGGVTGLATYRAANGLAANGSQDLLPAPGTAVSHRVAYAFNVPGGTPGGLPTVGAGRTFSYVRRTAASNPGISYRAQTAPELATWTDVPAAQEQVTPIDAAWERLTIVLPSGDEIFARVAVDAP